MIFKRVIAPTGSPVTISIVMKKLLSSEFLYLFLYVYVKRQTPIYITIIIVKNISLETTVKIFPLKIKFEKDKYINNSNPLTINAKCCFLFILQLP